jgi:hypothetical protein
VSDDWFDDPELQVIAEAERRKYRADVKDELPVEPLTPIDPASLDGIPVPPRQWLVPDWVPMTRATSLYGGGGEGKLLAQMLATACALDGAKWLGLPVRRCNSLLYFCEDDLDEMHRRQEDINQHYGCSFADLSAMRWLPRLGEDNALMILDGGKNPRSRRQFRNKSSDGLVNLTKISEVVCFLQMLWESNLPPNL